MSIMYHPQARRGRVSTTAAFLRVLAALILLISCSGSKNILAKAVQDDGGVPTSRSYVRAETNSDSSASVFGDRMLSATVDESAVQEAAIEERSLRATSVDTGEGGSTFATKKGRKWRVYLPHMHL
jgi:fatty acid-binding protein DegV